MAKTRLIDIAKLAGVSKATASRALSGSALVKDATRDHVLEIAQRLKYKPNALAQAMATKRSGILGFLLYKKGKPYFGHTFFGPVLDGAIDQAQMQHYHIVLASTSDEKGNTFDEHFIQDSIDGAILVSFDPMAAVEEFRRRRIPLVLINEILPTEHNAFILDENYDGARAVMEHLISRGHRDIAIVADRFSHTSYMLRYMGYLHAHHKHALSVYANPSLPAQDILGGYPINEHILKSNFQLKRLPLEGTPLMVHSTSPDAGEEAVKQLLATKHIPTAIFAMTDSLAIGCIRALKAAGLRVPEDVAVAGYDDVEAAQISDPTLTTVRVDREAIGRVAVSELLRQIENPQLPSRTVYVRNQLIIRDST